MSDIQLRLRRAARAPMSASPQRRTTPGRKRGPKGPHAGNFKPGYDPRRAKYSEQTLAITATYGGKTLAQLARDATPQVFGVLFEATTREDVPWPVRVSASQYLADRGWGRAPQVVDFNVNGGNTLSLADTLRLMATVSPELLSRLEQGTVIEGQLVHNQLLPATPASENKG
jgi:hypothetical protein